MTIRVLARGTVKREDREAFGALVQELTATVREKDAGKTLVYDFFLSEGDEDGNCVAHEAYVDTAALIQHFQTIAPYTRTLGKLLDTKQIQFFGAVPKPLLEQVMAIAPVEVHAGHIGGI